MSQIYMADERARKLLFVLVGDLEQNKSDLIGKYTELLILEKGDECGKTSGWEGKYKSTEEEIEEIVKKIRKTYIKVNELKYKLKIPRESEDEINTTIIEIIESAKKESDKKYGSWERERQRWLLANVANCLEDYGEKKIEIDTSCSIEYAMKTLNLLGEEHVPCIDIKDIAARDKIVFNLNNEDQKKEFKSLKSETDKARRWQSPTKEHVKGLLQKLGVNILDGGRKTRRRKRKYKKRKTRKGSKTKKRTQKRGKRKKHQTRKK